MTVHYFLELSEKHFLAFTDKNATRLPTALRAIQTEANQLLSTATSDPSPKSPQPGPSGLQATSTQLIPSSPEDIRPLPRAGPRSETKRKYKKLKTAILTDTPEKMQLRRNITKVKRTLLTAKGKGKGEKTENPIEKREIFFSHQTRLGYNVAIVKIGLTLRASKMIHITCAIIASLNRNIDLIIAYGQLFHIKY
ncbi:hypothetical protein JTB14_018126 [Gonioctena quinquepunctata]|nr:hypothetical protein JTB14_018126 [Gonioctena quinquepunctata]